MTGWWCWVSQKSYLDNNQIRSMLVHIYLWLTYEGLIIHFPVRFFRLRIRSLRNTQCNWRIYMIKHIQWMSCFLYLLSVHQNQNLKRRKHGEDILMLIVIPFIFFLHCTFLCRESHQKLNCFPNNSDSFTTTVIAFIGNFSRPIACICLRINFYAIMLFPGYFLQL